MLGSVSEPKPEPQTDTTVAVTGYQTAVGLATFYANTVWSVFNAMLVANTIVVAVLTMAAQNPKSSPVLKYALAFAGVMLCLCWLVIVKRAHEFAAYYTLSAREIEESTLARMLTTLSRGGMLADGREVTLRISGMDKALRLGPLPRHVRGQTASLVIVSVFLVVYVLVPFLT